TATVVNLPTTNLRWTINPAVGTINDGTGLYTAPAVILTNQTVTVTATSVSDARVSSTATVNLTAGTEPRITAAGAAHAASLAGVQTVGGVSPGLIVTFFGARIGPAAAAGLRLDSATNRVATETGGVRVLFDGTPAPMVAAIASQVSAIVP